MKWSHKCLALVLVLAMCLIGCADPQATPPTTTTAGTTPSTTTQPQTQPTTIPQTTAPTTPEIPLGYRLGARIPDFTVTTWDNKTLSLYEVLQEKEMVLINIWATWCGPCRVEFPYLQEAYEMYQDRIEVIALSCETGDTPEVLADFVDKMGLTFPIGQDVHRLLSKFNRNSIPTSIVIDRFGVICFIESGSITDLDSFVRLFETFLGEDYTESKLLRGIPEAQPETDNSTGE